MLLSEEERILADNLLGDDWESNAAAIDRALDDAFMAQGGGGQESNGAQGTEGVD